MADQTTALAGAAGTGKARRPNFVMTSLEFTGELVLLLWRTLRAIKGGIDGRDLVAQMASLGVNSISIALLTSFTSGAVLSLYFAPFLKQYGAESFAGAVVCLAISRELAPVLTGVVVAARAGSAIAAELGSMVVSEQIDALRALAVSPIQYLVVPRLLAALIMLPVVGILADTAGIFGGFLIAVQLEGVPPSVFTSSIREFLTPRDVVMGLIKTIVFGLIIALVGCQQGLATRGGATEVGRATTNAVVISIVLLYVANFALTYVMFTKVTQF